MDNIQGAAEIALREIILTHHRSIRAFAIDLGLPCSTINNVLRRGVASVNLSTAAAICDALGLDMAAFVRGQIAPATGGQADPWEQELLDDCRSLDGHGRQMVSMVAKKERERCCGQMIEFPRRGGAGTDSWRQYVGVPIACRGGGVTEATEKDAKQMDKIYRRLIDGKDMG